MHNKTFLLLRTHTPIEPLQAIRNDSQYFVEPGVLFPRAMSERVGEIHA